MRTSIFACVHNAGRPQMSAAFFNKLADPELARGISAGTQPAEHVHPGLWTRCAKWESTSAMLSRKPHGGTGTRRRDADYDGLWL
jgi:protein-tyrosine-phosphatase